jgi:hypothetical protein
MQFFCAEHFLFATFLGPYLPKGRPVTVVDAGANIGLASILYSQVINFNGEVLAIEANPSTLEVCLQAALLTVQCVMCECYCSDLSIALALHVASLHLQFTLA